MTRAPARHGLVATAATLLLVLPVLLVLLTGALGPAAGAEETDPAATTVGPRALDDAVLAWELNDESNNKAFAPGTYNFLSAGAVPDPGRGGQAVVAPGVWRGTQTRAWRARAGSVTVQKQRADGSWSTATFAGLSTSRDGQPLTSTTGPFSGHRVVLDGGTGTVDPAGGTATIRWTGTFSVLYYSGLTFFTVTDPVLTVVDGVGTLRATLAGFAADREDPERWAAVPPQRGVVLADLPSVDLDAVDGGLVAEPAYRGVRYDGGGQVREGSDWGAFPASYLTYMERVGSPAFWYSSGGAADPHKVPAPLSVTYDADDPVTPPTDPGGPTTTPPTGPTGPTASPTTTLGPTPPEPTDPIDPTDPAQTPTPTAAPTTAAPPTTTQPPGPSIPPQPGSEVPPAGGPTGSGGPAGVPVAAPPAPIYALTGATTEAAPVGSGAAAWPWWLGTLLLTGAAGLTVATARARRPPRTPPPVEPT